MTKDTPPLQLDAATEEEMDRIIDEPMSFIEAQTGDENVRANFKAAVLAWHTKTLQQRLNEVTLEAYDEALFDSGYEKRQVGPVTREIVNGKRQKYRIALSSGFPEVGGKKS